MRARFKHAGALAAVVLGLAACQEQMRESSFVHKLRILGVRAEDPEMTVAFPYGPDSIPVFKPSGTALSALVADPEGGGRPVTLQWSVCLVPDIGEDAVDFNCDGDNGLRLAGGAFSPPLLARTLAGSGLQADFEPSEGFSTSLQSGIPVYLWLRAHAGEDTTAGLKRIVLSIREARNRNPVLKELRADGVDLMRAGDVSFMAGRVFEFEPVWEEATLDRYVDEVNNIEKTEEPFFSWFATDGEWSAVYTNRSEPQNRWTSPDLAGGAPRTVDMWFVMHDARGGVDWFEMKGAAVVP
ncbi:MAG: hypothetical protein HY897_11430 [Deltaproteobacteria bacterium]|nr:hypothetical protein [Deltaproteobacteria bacterium]